MEKSPKLSLEQLPKNLRVKKDAMLRGASAEEVIGAIRIWLTNERPSHSSVMVTLARDSADLDRVEQRWKRICRANNQPEEYGIIDRISRAVTFAREILLLPEVVLELEAVNTLLRARGVGTFMHEWWHISRKEPKAFYPFEEGTADTFASTMIERAFGFKPPRDWRFYDSLQEAVDLIGRTLDQDNWYLISRDQTDVRAWLKQKLLDAGFGLQAVEDVLLYTQDGNVWLTRVRRMIATKED